VLIAQASGYLSCGYLLLFGDLPTIRVNEHLSKE